LIASLLNGFRRLNSKGNQGVFSIILPKKRCR
jgi:hypothetical protein